LTEYMRITSLGNVGIGTSSPAEKLEVEFNTNGYILADNSTDTNTGIKFANTGRTYGIFTDGGSGSSNSLRFYDFTASAERLRLDSAGNLGLGVTPSAWSAITALQVKNAFFGGASNSAYLGANAYYDGSAFKYIATGFANRYQQDSDGHLWFTAASGTAGGTISFTQAMTLTAAGELLVGGTTSLYGSSGKLTVEGAAGGVLSLFRNDTSVSAANNLGQINFWGNDTTSNTPTVLAFVNGVTSGTHSAGDNPTDVVFGTTPDGTGTAAEAGRVTQAGSYVLKGGTTSIAAGVGIIFPATQVASANANSLDDYEEGTWTPTIVGSTNPVYGASIAQGKYTKIGSMVYVEFLIVITSVTSQGVGNIQISGMPFSNSSGSYQSNISFTYNDTWDVNVRNGYTAGTVIQPVPNAVTQSNLGWAAATLSTGYFSGAGWYIA